MKRVLPKEDENILKRLIAMFPDGYEKHVRKVFQRAYDRGYDKAEGDVAGSVRNAYGTGYRNGQLESAGVSKT